MIVGRNDFVCLWSEKQSVHAQVYDYVGSYNTYVMMGSSGYMITQYHLVRHYLYQDTKGG